MTRTRCLNLQIIHHPVGQQILTGHPPLTGLEMRDVQRLDPTFPAESVRSHPKYP